jgi:hypothetical protein
MSDACGVGDHSGSGVDTRREEGDDRGDGLGWS